MAVHMSGRTGRPALRAKQRARQNVRRGRGRPISRSDRSIHY